MDSLTTAMGNNAFLPPPTTLPPFLLHQPTERMKGTTDLESADALQVLAFEPQAQFWVCGGAVGPLCALEGGRGLRCRGELAESVVCEDWCFVDVGLYERVGGEDGGETEWEGVWIGHIVWFRRER
jgi:hypothetical protein